MFCGTSHFLRSRKELTGDLTSPIHLLMNLVKIGMSILPNEEELMTIVPSVIWLMTTFSACAGSSTTTRVASKSIFSSVRSAARRFIVNSLALTVPLKETDWSSSVKVKFLTSINS